MNNELVIAYFIIVSIYGALEVFLELKYSRWVFKQKRKNELNILLASFFLSVYIAPIEYSFTSPTLYLPTIIIGFSLFAIGAYIRILTLQTLKYNFSPLAEAESHTKLILNGVYTYIRHPAYLGVLIMAISGCILFSCIFTYLLFIILTISILKRISKEEKDLLQNFAEYKEYKKNTRKLLPFIY